MDCLIGVPATLATMWCCCKAAFPEGTTKASRVAPVSRVDPVVDDASCSSDDDDETHIAHVHRAHMRLYGS